MAELTRRTFFGFVAGVIAGARSKPTTTGSLFNPHRDVYSDYFGPLRRKIGDTITIRRPARFAYRPTLVFNPPIMDIRAVQWREH